MRLTRFITALLLASAISNHAVAQTFHGPPRTYENLPTGEPEADASIDVPLTIVPPAQAPVTAPPMEGALAPMQPWTSDGVVYPPAAAPMAHAISAEPWDGGWFATVELTILRPVFNDLPVADRNHSVGPRLSFGWESDRGFGVRGRFWGLENDTELATIMGPVNLQTEAFRFDVDFYREFSFKGSSVTVGESITAADLKMTMDPLGTAEDSGGGMGVFIEGRHVLSQNIDSQWSVLGRGRWAGLVGEWEDPNNSPFIAGDSHMQIVEAGLGWEYKRKFDSCNFVLQHMLEIQTWDTSYTGDLSFFGQNVLLGFEF